MTEKLIEELMGITWQKTLGSFYIKSYVLKLLCDFIYRIKDRKNFDSNTKSVDASISEVEEYLTQQIPGPLPGVKHLTQRFSISERTLMRHFTKRHIFFLRKWNMQNS